MTNTCGGVLTAPEGGTTITLIGGVVGAAGLTAPNSCAISVRVRAITVGTKTNTTTLFSTQFPDGVTATASLLVAARMLIHFTANSDVGDSVLNITNPGTDLTAGGALTNICANVYTFSPDEQLISCCSCTVTPNALVSLSVKQDLTSNTLTPAVPTSVVVKIIPTAGTTCNAASVLEANVATGLEAWRTTLHALPTTPVTYGLTETPFTPAALSSADLARVTAFCGFIQANGSGFGICRSCRLGGLGAGKQ